MDKNCLGKTAESQALEFLSNRGLLLLERNFNTRLGEIDLIMRDKTELVFVEVRYRSSELHGGGSASVDLRKQKKLARAAQLYLLQHDLNNAHCRFDVISITQATDNKLRISWIKNAFYLNW